MMLSVLAVGGLLLAGRALAAPNDLVERTYNGVKYGCKCYYGDKCWPSDRAFNDLNKTVDGNLIVNIPAGAVCHNTFNGPLGTARTYNAAACARVTQEFNSNEQW
jgi:hypothetical protein